MATNKKDIIIGIDSSLSCTAFAVLKVKNNKLEVIEYEKIITTSEVSYLERCVIIAEKLDKVFAKYHDSILTCGIEQPNSFRNGSIVRQLCGLYGIILYLIWIRYKIAITEINTIHAKAVTTGNYRAKKPEIVESVNKLFNLKLVYKKTADKLKTDEDICDAISIARTLYMDLKKESK